MRALVYVQHLLGIGHLARIRRIAASLVEAGVETVLVEGGTPTGLAPAAGVETIQLTPVRVAANAMSLLLHADGSPFTEADKAARRDQLLAIAARHQPDILLIEAFPFGRRAMRFELLPLLAAAGRQGAAVIASSVRDILQESGDLRRAEETVETLNRHFDLLLVHGDEALTPLSLTFPLADRITAPIRYTGTVGPRPAAGVQHGYAAIVSAGGGVVGETLLATAVAARGLSPLADAPWLVLTGPNLPDEAFARLQEAAKAAGPGVTIERAVRDLASWMASAQVSISQAGYNTVADVLASGCAAVLCPFAAGGETEQTTRAKALAAERRAAVVSEEALAPDTLAAAISAALALPRAAPILHDGGTRSAQILCEAARAKRAAPRKESA